MMRLLLFFLVFTALFSACEKESAEIYSLSSAFKVDEGIITFNSLNEAKVFFSKFKDSSFDEIAFENRITEIIESTTFLPLQPFHEYENMSAENIEHYRELLLRNEHLIRTYQGSDFNTTDMDEDFDLFIKDEYFSSMLNIEGKIKIGLDIYHYTPFGLFIYNTSEGEETVKSVLNSSDKLHDLIRNKDLYSIPKLIEIGVKFYIPESQEGEFLHSGSVGTGRDIDESGFTFCGGMVNNTVWGSIFGPSSDCTDSYSHRRRIKTKIWSQNYLIYSSVGTSVRSQKKTIGWFASDIDELEIGIDNLSFTYPQIDFPTPDFPQLRLAYQLPNGQFIGQNGQVLAQSPFGNNATSIMQNFPINIDDDWISARIYARLFGSTLINENYSAAELLDINDRIDDLIRSSVNGALRDFAGIEDGFQIFDMNNQETAMIFANRVKGGFNRSRLQYILDWNTATLGFGGNPSTGNLNFDLTNFDAFGYEVMRALVWGGGRRGNTIGGNRVGMTL